MSIVNRESDITRIIAKLDAQAEPWTASWQDLTSLKYSQANYTSNAVSVVYRSAEGSNAANAEDLWHDAAAAFNLALRWKIENDTDCASTAAGILVDWANTLTSLGTSDDQYLTSGLQGHELANAAELLLDYSPFVEDGFSAVSDMLTNIFLAKNIYFLNHQAPSEHNHKHFFANWELANLASAMAIGVVTDNQTAFDYAIDYFKNGTGNGAIMNAITNLVEEPGTGRLLGQGQEAGRDQGHAGLDFQLLGVIGQQAYNQGEDLYGYADNRILQGAEYYARYNLGYDVPFENYTNNIVYYTEISNSSRGAYRPTWELLYNHYAVIKASENLNTTWTKGYRNYTVTSFGGYEGGAGSWGEGYSRIESNVKFYITIDLVYNRFNIFIFNSLRHHHCIPDNFLSNIHIHIENRIQNPMHIFDFFTNRLNKRCIQINHLSRFFIIIISVTHK
ncbi:putative gpi anchored protein [Phaeomoniella chlamydospora]|uniref:Putative gpi anchored protein n=1 Tax=Phaeomoniella chlamydospora TaxID=158046 RepID=A0A0G2DVB7_PHACM|nr:putative gpi anchored protein [Phaeomoniella chlamydospora]